MSTFDLITNVIGIGGILIGFVPLVLNGWRRAREMGLSCETVANCEEQG